MKKGLLVCIGVLFMSVSTVNAQAVEEGNVIIDAYYGFPNLYTATFKTAYANSGQEVNLKVGGLGPLGGRIEYLLTDKLGVGLDIGFNNSFVRYDEDQQVYNSTTGNYDNVTYTYDFSTRKLGALVSFNFHFLDNDQIDAYAVLATGYSNRTFTFDSNDPNYTAASVKGFIPIGFRLGAGMRYFFTDNIGINLSLGVGQGGIANGGLSVKF